MTALDEVRDRGCRPNILLAGRDQRGVSAVPGDRTAGMVRTNVHDSEGGVVRVLGVDPGLTRCGVGVVDGGTGRAVSCVAVGVARTPAEAALADRLLAVADVVEQWMETHRPEVVAIERVFSQHNVRTVMGTAQVSGVVALAAARRGLPVAFHTPSEVKAAISGSGRADKRQVTTMITKILGLESPPKPADAADALALAVCHVWRAPMSERIAEAEAKAAALARHHKQRLRKATGGPAAGSVSGRERSGTTRSGRSRGIGRDE